MAVGRQDTFEPVTLGTSSPMVAETCWSTATQAGVITTAQQ